MIVFVVCYSFQILCTEFLVLSLSGGFKICEKIINISTTAWLTVNIETWAVVNLANKIRDHEAMGIMNDIIDINCNPKIALM
jgi:hypothetical protein